MIETKATRWKKYPESVTYAIPVDEVPLPKSIESQLPSKTTHIEHTVYLGNQNHQTKATFGNNDPQLKAIHEMKYLLNPTMHL